MLARLIAEMAPPQSAAGALVYLLAAALTAALGTSGLQFYKYRKQAAREDDSLIAAATGEAIAAAKSMLIEYRVELDRARDDLRHMQAKLDVANERIVRLETDLQHATVDRERLQDELTVAIERRALMQREMDDMTQRMNELERFVHGIRDLET